MQHFPRLRSLHLAMTSNGNRVVSTLQPLCGLIRLESLQLYVSHMGSQPLLLPQDLSRLQGLTSLHLVRGEPDEEPAASIHNLEQAVSSMTRLSSLVLSGVTGRIPDCFSALVRLSSLQLHNHQSPPVSLEISPLLALCSSLKSMHIENNWVMGEDTFKALQGLTSVQDMSIEGVESLGLIPPAAIAFGTSTTCLRLAWTDLTDLPAAVCSLKSLKGLEFYGQAPVNLPIGPYLGQLTYLYTHRDCLGLGPGPGAWPLSSAILRSACNLQELGLSLA